jgi:hypothetical protein
VRMFRISLIAVLMIVVAGAAWACDHDKASAANASTSHCGAASVKTASAEHGGCTAAQASGCTAAQAATCTEAQKAACASKQAMAEHAEHCPYCGFVAALKANEGKVTMQTVDTPEGITVVFAAVGENAAAAQEVANKAYAMMAGPSQCSYTRDAMAKSSCDGCKAGLAAFAKADVSMQESETGATALVKTKDKEQIKKLHAFFAEVRTSEAKTEG